MSRKVKKARNTIIRASSIVGKVYRRSPYTDFSFITYNSNHQLVKVLDSAGARKISYNLQNQLDTEEVP